MNHRKLNRIFETERLEVRNLMLDDFDFFHDMQSDDEVMRYTTGKGFDEQENQRQLESCIDAYAKPDNQFWVWAITRKSDQQFVGTCAIVPNSGRAEIGFRFLRTFFGNGYGREICDGLLKYGIDIQKLEELIAYVDIRNVASRKILDHSILPFVEEVPNSEGGIDRFYHWTSDRDLSETS